MLNLKFCLVLLMAASWCVDASGPRHFPHFSRKVTLLDSPSWQFGLNLDPHFDSLSPGFVPSVSLTPNTTEVPSCFDAAGMGVQGVRGVGMYRTTFTVTKGLPSRLQFGACSFFCRIFVDGKQLGDHRAGGYSMFYVDVPPSTSEARELFVLADNRFNKTLAPTHTGGDFWLYGGLMRSVALHELPLSGEEPAEPAVWRAEVTTVHATKGVIDVRILLSDPNYAGNFHFTMAVDQGAASARSGMASGGVVLVANLTVPDPKLWDVDSPNLHTITVNQATSATGITERFGLRTFDVDPSTYRVRLNGRVLKLHGWNHHTQAPLVSDITRITASPTDAQFDADIQLLLNASTNYVRGAHYPQDQRWLDRLDEAGIVMWEETLGPGTSTANMNDPYFMKYQLQQVDEMLAASFNHPSIFTWGFFNEGPSNDKNACVGYKACSDRIKARDPHRFVTWASNKNDKDVCMEHATLVAYNHYPAWYDMEGDLTYPKTFWNKMADYVFNTLKKPFVISETGAGGIYEWNTNSTDAKWTVKYQTEVLVQDVEVSMANDKVSGVTLWHFFDFKVDDNKCGPCDYQPGVLPPTCSYINISSASGCGRPGGENHKGVVDAWRRPKEGYGVVGRLYNASKF